PAEDPQPQEHRLEEEGGQPLERERCAEHVAHVPGVLGPVQPNWNSCTMPVAIPMPKFTISIEPKNFVFRVQASLRSASFAYTARVCMMATSSESPIVSGTKMKWYTV